MIHRTSALFCVAWLLLGGLGALTAFGKGKPPDGGGGPTPPGTVFFLDVPGAAYWSMDADGGNKTYVMDQLADPNDFTAHLLRGAQPSYELHGGIRWFLDRQASSNGLELIARRAAGDSIVLWTDPDTTITARQFRWAKDDSFVVFLVHDSVRYVAQLRIADVAWDPVTGTPSLGPSAVLFELTLGDIRGFDVSPDGTQVAYYYYPNYSLRVRNLATGATLDLGQAGYSPEWSPDGSRIAFVRALRYNPKSGKSTPTVHTVRPDGSDLTEVAPGQHPNWSPDSAHLAFLRLVKDGKGRNAPSAYEVLRIASAGGSEVNMTADFSGDAWTSGWR